MRKGWFCIDVSGSKSGLSLVLNVEQYEYMRGPQNDAGIKVNMPKSEPWDFPYLFQFEDENFDFYGSGRTFGPTKMNVNIY